MVGFVTIGSCLVGVPAVYLMGEYKWKRLNDAKVDRSDHFLANFIDRTGAMPPREEILAFAAPLPEHEKAFLSELAECYPDTIGLFNCGAGHVPLQQNLDADNIDIILMDNMLETMVHGWSVDTAAGRFFTSTLPFQFCKDKDAILARTRSAPRLTARESVANWKRIIRFFRDAVPRAEIIFACAPCCLSGDDLERHRCSRDFHLLLEDEAEALGIDLIPPLDVEPQYTKLPDDRSHFDNAIYKAMAGHIVMCHSAKLSARLGLRAARSGRRNPATDMRRAS